MSATGVGPGPDEVVAGSWASESLPMSVRKALLEQELRRLGFPKKQARGGASAEGGAARQQQGEGAGRPQAGDSASHPD